MAWPAIFWAIILNLDVDLFFFFFCRPRAPLRTWRRSQCISKEDLWSNRLFHSYYYLFDLFFFHLPITAPPLKEVPEKSTQSWPVKNENGLWVLISFVFPSQEADSLKQFLHLPPTQFAGVGLKNCATLKIHVFVFLSHGSSDCCLNVIFLPSSNVKDSFWSNN